jgi:hypothetical protein
MTNETKWTPGPWTVKYRTEVGGMRDGNAVHIARVNKENPNLEANARLIAAAPELYSALARADALLRQIEDEALDRGRKCEQVQIMIVTTSAALARARGEK